MHTVKERFWIWGQNPGSHHKGGVFGLPGENLMTPVEGADYLGIKNCCRVVMGGLPCPPFDEDSLAMSKMKQVVWSAVGDSGSVRNDNDQDDLAEVLRQAEKFPNITGAVLDDFFNVAETEKDKMARHTVKSIRRMREKLHSFEKRKLDLWLVWYSWQLDLDIQDYLDLFDVITLWIWFSKDLSSLDDYIKKVIERTPGKRRFAGCYMWDYGDRKPMTDTEMEFQCEKYFDWMQKGWVEGIIFCSNCICDIGLNAVEWTKNWIAKIGDKSIG